MAYSGGDKPHHSQSHLVRAFTRTRKLTATHSLNRLSSQWVFAASVVAANPPRRVRPAPLAPLRRANPPPLRSTKCNKNARARQGQSPLAFCRISCSAAVPPCPPSLNRSGTLLRSARGGRGFAGATGTTSPRRRAGGYIVHSFQPAAFFGSRCDPPELFVSKGGLGAAFLLDFIVQWCKVKGKPEGATRTLDLHRCTLSCYSPAAK